LATPGFLENGIDFDQLGAYYKANKCHIEITDPAELSLIDKLMKHVIGESYGYNTDFASTIYGRFQMIFNATLQELEVKKFPDILKRSNAVWLLTDSYETGTDFLSSNGKRIEAKVYLNWYKMLEYAEKGSKDSTVFHGADYVLCYLIDSYQLNNSSKLKHWYWLKKINDKYEVFNDVSLEEYTEKYLDMIIPICKCIPLADKLIIRENI
jgi:hypothetical protein